MLSSAARVGLPAVLAPQFAMSGAAQQHLQAPQHHGAFILKRRCGGLSPKCCRQLLDLQPRLNQLRSLSLVLQCDRAGGSTPAACRAQCLVANTPQLHVCKVWRPRTCCPRTSSSLTSKAVCRPRAHSYEKPQPPRFLAALASTTGGGAIGWRRRHASSAGSAFQHDTHLSFLGRHLRSAKASAK